MNGLVPRLCSQSMLGQTLEELVDQFRMLGLDDPDEARVDVLSPRSQNALVGDFLDEGVLQGEPASREHLRLVEQVRVLQAPHLVIERLAMKSGDPPQQVEGDVAADDGRSLQDAAARPPGGDRPGQRSPTAR